MVALLARDGIRFLDSGPEGRAVPVLLLLHAFPMGAGMWEPQIAGFPGWRVIAPAYQGFDGSAPAEAPSIDDYAAHALRLLDLLEVPAAVLGGLSIGCHVALAALRQAPGRVAGLVLADTRSPGDDDAAREGRRRMHALVLEAGAHAVADQMIQRGLGPTTVASRPAVVARFRRLIEAQSPRAIGDALGVLMTRPDADDTLPTISVPTLFVVGEEDGLSPPDEMARMCALVPGATLARLPGVGHFSNMEDPDAFNRAVSAFLSALPR